MPGVESTAQRVSAGTRRPVASVLAACLAATLAIGGCGNASPPNPTGAGATPVGTSAPAPSAIPSAIPSTRPSVADSPTVAEIDRLTAATKADPTDAEAQQGLGFALMQRVRETADPSLYAPAMAAFEAALTAQPDDAMALAGIAGVQLGRHEFRAALDSASQAIELAPSLVPAHAARFDALIELGRYEEADTAAGVLLGLSVDLATLARVSYLAELKGDLPVALAAMQRAARSPGLAPENSAFVQALLGNLLIYSGEPWSAESAYEAALALVPDHAPSIAGLGRLAVGQGRVDDAIEQFERAAAIVPLPEYMVALGDAQLAAGDAAGSARSFDVARAEIQLFKAAGVVVDVDLAVFEADHGDPAVALDYAMAAHRTAATVRAADAVAWALHRLGRSTEAADYAAEALRLGSIEPSLRYHAGAIAAALGDTTAARRDLAMALSLDPGFSAVGAAEARRLLDTLP